MITPTTAPVLTHIDVCSGVGCFGIAAHHAGFQTRAFCEIEEYPRRVLARHFPDAYIHDDIKTFTGSVVRQRGIDRVDLLSGGFPCQDISCAGKGGGLDGQRSGLWYEMLRVINETRPVWVVAENVPALRTRGIDTVLSGLESAGYTAGAFVVGAWAAGAPHERERVWIVAHSRSLPNAETDTPANPVRGERDAWGNDGGRSGSRAPQSDRRIPEPGMGRSTNGSASRLDGLRWPATIGVSSFDWEPEKSAPKSKHHDERMKSIGNAIVWPVAAAIFGTIREAIS